MSVSLSVSLKQIRSLLLDLQPTGAAGFEGLVASVLARMTGLVIRLAKSGSQFGRDASSLPGAFAVAMECKRYDVDLRLEDLMGKITVAGSVLEGLVDLYVLGATSAVGDDTVQKLTAFLEERGVVLLPLDWAECPLPPLAVALAAERAATLEWFAEQATSVDATQLGSYLDAIAAAEPFGAQLVQLRDAVSAARVGLEPFRRHAEAWLEHRLTNSSASRLAFGQYVTVSASDAPAVPRGSLADLDRMLTRPIEEPTVVAVLGAEGTGKTWLAAQWWTRQETRPPLLLVAGQRTRLLDPDDPARTVAHLAAAQHGVATDVDVARWQRRFERWETTLDGSNSTPRLVVILDGINEHPRIPWASIIGGLARKLHAFGGRLVVTSRPGYWQEEVRPRLGADLQVADLRIDGYTDEELRAVLAAFGVDIDALSGRVREFVRNPRVCRVAMRLLRRLSLHPGELTVERLLLDYWHQRLEERGDSVAHNVREFERLLQEHARQWRGSPRRKFDRDHWAQFSGAVERKDLDRVLNDLTEIEEGRFMTITDPDRGEYTFRPETLPFAIGLLLRDELREVVDDGKQVPEDALARMLDPVRGFDQLADMVTAAVGLACLERYPERGRTALVNAWLSLQNVSADAVESLATYFIASPGTFLDVIERPDPAVVGSPGADALVAVLHSVRDHPAVAVALEVRLDRWLGRWSREGLRFGEGAADAERQARRDEYISERWSELSTEERRLFDELTTESPRGLVPLDRLAARLCASRELVARVEALMGWAFAQTIAGDVDSATHDIEWVARLNNKDPVAVRSAALAFADRIGGDGSRAAREAAALLLRTLGDVTANTRAEALAPLATDRRWRPAERISDADPCDPSTDPSSLDIARARVAELDPARVWTSMGMTTEDYELERTLPLLIRFDLPCAVETLHRVVTTAPERRGITLRQLAWRLPGLSPIFDVACVDALRVARDRLLSDRERSNARDYYWVLGHIMTALAPHLEPTEQLDQLRRIPEGTPLLVDLQRALRPLSPADTERALVEAAERSDAALIRVLLFVAESRSRLTVRARDAVVRALCSEDSGVASLAAHVVYRLDDAVLDDTLLAAARAGTLSQRAKDVEFLARELGRAISAAVVRSSRDDAVDLVPARYLESVAGALGGTAGDEAQRRFVAAAEDNFERLCSGQLPSPPSTIALTAQVSVDSMEVHRSVAPSDVPDQGSQASRIEASQLSLADQDELRAAEHEVLREHASAYLNLLERTGGAVIAEPPPFDGFSRLAAECPSRICAWLREITAIDDPLTLGNIQNMGYALASVFAGHDGDLASAVFRHLDRVHAIVMVTFGPEQVWVRDRALFEAAPVPAITELRCERFRDAFDDASLADATLAAELYGAQDWLDGFVEDLVGSASAGEVARGLAIAGFRLERPGAIQAFGRDWGKGFLGGVAQAARVAYDRARWAHHWLAELAAATDGPRFWRVAELAIRVADARALLVQRDIRDGDLVRAYGGEVSARLGQAAKKVREDRAKTLFGLQRPPHDLVDALRGRVG
jgi:hypothetical protein